MKVYDQHCPLASALDVIGDRWTLLIVRELLFLGPRRFTDLSRALPGMAPNLLSSRLRTLEDAGVVGREPSSVKVSAYRLTDEGMGLREPVVALMRWGVHHMVPLAADEVVRPEMVTIGLQAAFVPRAAAGLDARYELIFEDATVRARVVSGALEVELNGPAAPEPDLRIEMPLRTFVEVVNGEVDAVTAAASGLVETEGDPDQIDQFLRVFGGLVQISAGHTLDPEEI